MKKTLGIFGLLVFVFFLTSLMSESFLTPYNLENLIRRTSLFGIISIGVAFVIITGGIDLSIGSVICLVGCGLPWLLTEQDWSVGGALFMIGFISLAIGLIHGLMIAKLKLQPFVVTLCGLLFYRGITRGFTADQTQGLGDAYPKLRLLATAELAKVTAAQALFILGAICLLIAAIWFFVARKRGGLVKDVKLSLGVTALLALFFFGAGMKSSNYRPVVEFTASETESVAVDLPDGTLKVSLEGNAGGGWQSLAELPVQPSDDKQQLNAPSLSKLREQKPGEWSELRIVVTERVMTKIGIPAPCVILGIVAVLAGIFLNHTIYGRYLLALGNNEEAAKYSGIDTDKMIILAYVICSACAGLGGMLFVLDVNSAQPVDFGNFYELYAIAAAVLGGCSLRGGAGSIVGVLIGAALMRVLRNTITLVDWIPTHIEYAVIGIVILGGVTVDELLKRVAAKRRAAAEAKRGA